LVFWFISIIGGRKPDFAEASEGKGVLEGVGTVGVVCPD